MTDPQHGARIPQHKASTAPSGATNLLLRGVQTIEGREGLDPIVDRLRAAAPAPLRQGPLRRLLGGSWLGHALHPLMTDVPLGAWTSATLLDLFGGRRARPFATGLVGVGVASAVPTAAAGLSDWLVSDRESQRVGIVHAASNGAALTLYTASLVARMRRRHALGVVLGVSGGLAAAVGGYLGGHLTLVRATGIEATRDALAQGNDDGRDRPSTDLGEAVVGDRTRGASRAQVSASVDTER